MGQRGAVLHRQRAACPLIQPAIAKSSSPGIRSWIQTFPACYLFQCFQLALRSTGTSCLKPAEPHAKRTSAWKAAPPADPALEGCLPVSARSQTYPCTHKAKPVHSRARSKKSHSGKPQPPFPLQKLWKIIFIFFFLDLGNISSYSGHF